MKKLVPRLQIPLALLQGASLVRISQLRNSALTQGVLASRLDGGIYVAGGLSFDASGNVVLPPAPPPAITTVFTKVISSSQNSFPIPAGKTLILVIRNIPQFLNEDYSIQGGAVVFNSAPQVDDCVGLIVH